MRNDLFITIFDGSDQNVVVNLAEFNKDVVCFGRGHDNDIVLTSTLASKKHGYFAYNGEAWDMYDSDSTNGIFWNGRKIKNKQLSNGDKLLIGYEETSNKVAFVFSTSSPRNLYKKFVLAGQSVVTIGRDMGSDIPVSHAAVFKQHGKIIAERDGYYIDKVNSNTPIQLNGVEMTEKTRLCEMDRFMIGDVQFIYQNQMLYYIKIADGLSFDVSHLSKIVGHGKSRKKINTDINFSIDAGEFVAIVGGSGAGKSTLLNCLCGCGSISEGNVLINGEDLASNYNILKNLIGYVPQQDIVYDNLTLERMLYFTAKLRMPKDSTEEEINCRITAALTAVELTDRRELLIKKLSGGQRKRASIAVELLSDPKLFFLDEPTSGLDPGTERNLMKTLKGMTTQGKTVVLVTHTPLNLNLCDKVVIMGRGGRLCYCGSPTGALEFFHVDSFVDIYDLINNDSVTWAEKYLKKNDNSAAFTSSDMSIVSDAKKQTSNMSSMRQLLYLVQRYLELSVHDVKRMLIQILMAPGLGLLQFLAFGESYPFKASYDTQKLALTLACCAFWIGLFNSIQEICKERRIYKRERMANLRLMPYVGSKLIVNAALDLIQTLLLILVVRVTIGMPESGMQFENFPTLEIFITTYLTMLSATCLGLTVSALAENSDQAISIAPILLIPQILFSGIIVELEGVINKVSYIISCRHACVAYCTTADINNLPSSYKLTALGEEAGAAVIIDSMYSYTGNVNATLESWFGSDFALAVSNPVMSGWGALFLLCVFTAAATVAVLKYKK